jgi:hypothetical protein
MRLSEEAMLEKYNDWIWKNYHELARYFYSLDPEDIFQECQLGFLLSVRALDSRGDNLRDNGIFALSKVAMYRRVHNLLAKEMLQRKARTEVSLNKEDWWACAPLSLHPTDVIRFNRFRENALSQNFQKIKIAKGAKRNPKHGKARAHSSKKGGKGYDRRKSKSETKRQAEESG